MIMAFEALRRRRIDFGATATIRCTRPVPPPTALRPPGLESTCGAAFGLGLARLCLGACAGAVERRTRAPEGGGES